MLVVLEIFVFLILIITNIIIFYKKDRHKMFLFTTIIFIISLICIGITLLFSKPKIDISDVLIVEVNSKEIQRPTTHYLFWDITDKIKIQGKYDLQTLGKYEIEFIIPTLLKEYHQKQIIEVTDHTPPVITLNKEEEMTLSYKEEYLEPGASAIDNYDGDLTDKINIEKNKIEEEKLEIKYTVQDTSGNTAIKTRYVTLIDDVAPNLSLIGDEYLTITLNNKYVEQGAKAIDEKDGDLSENISISGTVDTSKIGDYEITYSIMDSKKNLATKKRYVKVVNQKTTPSFKEIYLTFDDGPSAYTGLLLDILKKYNVKATFFVTNQGLTNGYDAFIKRAYQEGHTIGLHTYSHNYKEIYQSENTYFQDLQAISDKVKKITGYESKIIRFPGGSSNTISKFNPGIMSRITKEVEKRGYAYFDWNLSSGDAGSATTSAEVSSNVIKGLGNGSYVILQHDIKKFSIEAVPTIIEYGISHGYTFKALALNSPKMHHKINN